MGSMRHRTDAAVHRSARRSVRRHGQEADRIGREGLCAPAGKQSRAPGTGFLRVSQKGSGPGLISNERREESDGQALAALGTAGAQHGTTTPAFLANQEAMSSFTTADGGLIGALHDGYQKGRGGSRVCEGRRRFSRNPLLDRQNEGFVNYFRASRCPDSR